MTAVRDSRMDSIKGLLILFVILGHFLTHNTHQSLVSEICADFIYSFHMPLFVFISGYFSRHFDNKKKFWKGILRIFETYVFFQIIKAVRFKYSLAWFFIMPAPMLWYLFALMLWRIIYYALVNMKCCGKHLNMVLLIATLLLSLGIGFIPSVGRILALSRFFVFAPWFVLGIMMQEKNILDECDKMSNIWAWGILFVILILIIAKNITGFNIPLRRVFAGTASYPADNQCLFCLYRLLCYVTSFIISVAVIRVVRKPNNFMNEVGVNTMKYYMFHGVVLMFFAPWSTPIAFISAACVIAGIYFFNKWKFSDFCINPVTYLINTRKKNGENIN